MPNPIHSLLQAMDDLNNAFVTVPSFIAGTSRASRQHTKQEKALIPPQPSQRKRRLTFPLPEEPPPPASKFPLLRGKGKGNKAQQTTLPQPSSPLLRLPAELRAMIWKQAICGGDAGEVYISRRITQSGLPPGHWRENPESWPVASRISSSGRDDVYGLGIMGLLCSCRVIYSEVVSLLYSTPTFVVWFPATVGADVFLAWMGEMLEERRGLVKRIRLVPGHDGFSRALDYGELKGRPIRSRLPDGRKGGEGVKGWWAVGEVLGSMGGLEKETKDILRSKFPAQIGGPVD